MKGNKYEKYSKVCQRMISVLIIICFLIMIAFDYYPTISFFSEKVLRVALYLIVDFSIALFFIELVVRFFLWRKQRIRHKTLETDKESSWLDTYDLKIISLIDIIILCLVIYGLFNSHIILYGFRIVTLLAVWIHPNNKTQNSDHFINLKQFIEYYHKDTEYDSDHNQTDDKNKFLRYLVYLNLLCFTILALENIKQTENLVAAWFVTTFVAALSSLFYIADLYIRKNFIRDKTNVHGWQLVKEFFFKTTYGKWNIIDTILTIIASLSIIDIFLTTIGIFLKTDNLNEIIQESSFMTDNGSTYSRFAMIIRPFAQLRIFKTEKSLQKITDTILKSFSEIISAFIYFVALFIIYGAAGYMLFNDSGPHFVDYNESIKSLFRIMTFESWGVLMEETIKPDKVPSGVVIGYFYSFVIIVSYIMWSVIQGVIVSKVQEVEFEQNKKDSKPDISNEQLMKKLDEINTKIEQLNAEVNELKQQK